MHNPTSVLENDTHNYFCGLGCFFQFLVKLKKNEKKDKYFDLARELKKLWDMKVKIMPIVIGAHGTVTNGLIKGLEDIEIRGRVETIQTTELLRSATILRRVLET